MGLSAVVIVVKEGRPFATSSHEAWRDLIKSGAAVIGRRPRLSAMHDLYILSTIEGGAATIAKPNLFTMDISMDISMDIPLRALG